MSDNTLISDFIHPLINRFITHLFQVPVALKRGSGSPDSVHVDSHMRCLPSEEDSSEPHIFSEIRSLFISAFNTLTLCKLWAYFALN